MESRIYVNGTITAPDKAVVPVLDRGLLYGDSVYEVLWWHDGAPIQLEAHLQRLTQSAQAMYLPLPHSGEALVQAMAETIKAAHVTPADDVYVRLMVTRGVGPVELVIDGASDAGLILIVKPANRPDAERFERGLTMTFVARRRVSKLALDPSAKTGNYMNNVLALHEARLAGADDALLLNAAGQVTEATTSNVYVVRQGALTTPALEAGLLEGTTRKRILALCETLSIPADESTLHPDDVRGADEVFVSSSVRGLMPVVRVDDTPIFPGAGSSAAGSSGAGPITRRLHAAFEAAASADAAAWHATRSTSG